ncbi:MAG: glycoside hydrolase family 9 protein [Lachnospiraceae bacterium]|nr:glycoside hydrolase family 9 protein [Lachnospiraceae bacterium]
MKIYENTKLPPMRSTYAVRIDQCGYLPGMRKIARIAAPCKSMKLCRANGTAVLEKEAVCTGPDELSGDTLYAADFSEVRESGSYYIETDGGERSAGFAIGEKALDLVFEGMMKAFYYLRCGMDLEPQYAGKFTHKACHLGKAKLWWDHGTEIHAPGGWHDAGDYGRYVTAGACALQHLLLAWRMYPEAFEVTGEDGRRTGRTWNIPESGGPLPDLLAECKYELDWMLKLQLPDGGVSHKETTAFHAPFIMPEEDLEQLYFYAVSSMATADFAAICANASVIYRPFDVSYANLLIEAAEKSYAWLEEHPEFLGFQNPPDSGTGGYGEGGDRDNRYWAAAEMYAATGEERYHRDLKELLRERDEAAQRLKDLEASGQEIGWEERMAAFSLTDLGYGSVGGFGSIAYLLAEEKGRTPDADLKERLRGAFAAEAEYRSGIAERCGYEAAMLRHDYCWGSNMVLMKHGMLFGIADYLEGTDRYYERAAAQLHCLLGVNAPGACYVTGFGATRVENPHLRPAYADGIEACIPGYVAGGPNGRPCDHDMQFLDYPENLPPMKCFSDSVSCFSLNEITIYWNSPAVFTCARILAGGKQ